jgi:8-oxo-dGTP diphosphatase
MGHTPQHSVSVAGIVVRDDGRVLVVQRRDNSHWEPPGGVLELGETFDQGVRREIFEETGVHVRVDRLTGAYKNLNRGVVALVFRCTALAGEPTTSDESRNVRWFTPDQVREHMAPAYAVRVADALNGGPEHRAHDGVHLVTT